MSSILRRSLPSKGAKRRLVPLAGGRLQRPLLRVLFEPAEEGGYVVTCPALPGLVTEGDTLEEMLANIREAIACYLDVPGPALPEKARLEEVEI